MSKPIKAAGFIPISRLEALTDAVLAFAMTLLVINIELPEGFHPKTNQEFLHGLSSLSDTFIAYLITFFVLVGFWFGRAKETGEPEMASPAYARVVFLHLLGVTF
ncbi:MAG TPA: TMEM175 family protein [Methyloceanibacter sp.]|nr:TMEM175 family protein [Methyloceanibacter sp.]